MTRLTLKQECRKTREEMYQRLMQAIESGWQSERRSHEAGEFPGLAVGIVQRYDEKHDEEMEASVKLRLPELKWLESQMWRLRRIFLDQTDVLEQRKTASILITVEVILGKVLRAFSEEYLDRENWDKLSFLTSSGG